MENNRLILGWHTSITPTIISGIQFNQVTHLSNESEFGVAAQIFLKSPMKFGLPKFSDMDIRKTKLYIERFNIFLVVHGSYLINFIRPSVEINFAIKSLVDDIRLLDQITNNSGVVIHMGKKPDKKMTDKECIKNFGENILKVIEKTENCSSKIILETSVKTKIGTDIFHDIKIFGKLIKHLKEILGKTVFKKRISCCIDTCHVYASGYDIRTKEKFKEFIQLWDIHIGIENISLFHLNDLEKKAENLCEGLGCCRDLHEELGKGLIYEDQKDGLKALLLFAKKNGISVISETGGNQDKELKLIKALNL